MKQLNGKFLISAEKLSQCPNYTLCEYPLLGRSNVGKSSFINAISNNNKLAKTSNTPGKTRLINFFDFAGKFTIADLPGYGYAKVSKEAQNKWQKYLEEYLLKREQITSLVQFIDGRHDIQKNDYQMREWVLAYNLPIFTIVTKIDLISKNDIQKRMAHVRKEFGGEVFPFSTNNRQYFEEVINHFLLLTQQSKEQYE
ncbi:MAG: ribosome biogenesis GTP-binding protein YihA/YsxC [bacterium]|nr:ribosome biogenesis GTP-binding protein YihA/YsxC [bacterium]